jgi:hypothetical protein
MTEDGIGMELEEYFPFIDESLPRIGNSHFIQMLEPLDGLDLITMAHLAKQWGEAFYMLRQLFPAAVSRRQRKCGASQQDETTPARENTAVFI